MVTIFVNFRNGDENYTAAMLYDKLAERFGADQVFRSTNSLQPGVEFSSALLENLRACRIVLVVIGPRWLESTDGSGRKRLWKQADWVRREIAIALSEGKEVIPVMLYDLPRLAPDELPPSIRRLAMLQSVKLDHRDLKAGVASLLDMLSRKQSEPPASRPPGTSKFPMRLWYAVDRADLLARVHSVITRHSVAVLHGRSGVGKTQLAAEYAHRHADEHHSTWWVSGERPELITEQLRELALAAGIDPRSGVERLFRELDRRGPWLLVVDGVDDVRLLEDLLASSPSRALITSNDQRRARPAVMVDVPAFTRSESVRFLTEELSHVRTGEADDLAAALDDLPLAVAQAVDFLRESTIGVRRYRELLDTRTSAVLARGISPTYTRTLARVWSLALESLESTSPAGAELAFLCTFFAATPIPVDLFSAAAGELDSPLGTAALDPISLDDAAAAVARSGLLTVRTGHLRPHRLFQRYIRDQMTVEETARARTAARLVLSADHPGDPRSAGSWARYAVLLPHLLELDLLRANDPRSRRLALDSSHYLVVLGDARTARNLVSDALRHWTDVLGAQHPDVVEATSHLARAHFHLGEYHLSQDLDERVVLLRRQELGPDHPDTLAAEHDLATDRWALSHQGSELLHEDVLRRRREILGADHPDTLRTAHNLALHLREARSPAEALVLGKDTHERFARVLGLDHIDTLRCAHSVAVNLRLIGQVAESRSWNEDTLARFRLVLGEDHIETLRCANNLALDLRALGEDSAADLLDRDTRARLQRLPR